MFDLPEPPFKHRSRLGRSERSTNTSKGDCRNRAIAVHKGHHRLCEDLKSLLEAQFAEVTEARKLGRLNRLEKIV